MIDVLKKIDELRKSRGWTVYRLGAETGLTPQAIHAWYKKNSIPSIATLEVVCEAFNMTLPEFFTDKESGYTIEVTPQVKAMHNKWLALSNEEKRQVDALAKKLLGSD